MIGIKALPQKKAGFGKLLYPQQSRTFGFRLGKFFDLFRRVHFLVKTKVNTGRRIINSRKNKFKRLFKK
jgi:hypothetical protein